MKFAFKDIVNTEIYETSSVLFVFGQHNIFNNIAIDTLRDTCKAEDENIDYDPLWAQEFEDIDSITISNTLSLENFIKTIHTAPIDGLWFCSADLSFMTKKQKDWLKNYMKNPSVNGKLAVFCNEYKDFRPYLKDKVINNSNKIHLIQLSFPNRITLEEVVTELFNQRNVRIERSALELFIIRMSNSYDDYEEIIDKIVATVVPKDQGKQDPNWKYTITYDDCFQAMKGIENFVLDDFIDMLLVPIKEKGKKINKTYRVLNALSSEMGPRQLVNKLKSKIDDYIEFRSAINSGYIPILVKFSVSEAKEALGEDSRLCRFSDYTFRRMALIASKTSMNDWIYMKLILSNVRNKFRDESYERVLHSLINRTIFNQTRLGNDIGVLNTLGSDLQILNMVPYTIEKEENKGEEVLEACNS